MLAVAAYHAHVRVNFLVQHNKTMSNYDPVLAASRTSLSTNFLISRSRKTLGVSTLVYMYMHICRGWHTCSAVHTYAFCAAWNSVLWF